MALSQPTTGAIPWHRRLEAQVVTSVVVVAGISLVALLAAASQVVSTRSLARADADLGRAVATFNHLIDARTREAAKQTRLVVELPTFRGLLTDTAAASDAATMTAMVGDYRDKLGAAFGVVTDRQGRWTGRVGIDDGARATAELRDLVNAALAGLSASKIVRLDDALYLVVAEPAQFAEEVLGTLTAGFRLDDEVAKELAVITHGEVSLVCGPALICGSSLPADARAALTALLREGGGELGRIDGAPARRTIGRTVYVGAMYPLPSGSASAARLVLLQDWTPVAQMLSGIRVALAQVGAATLLTALGAAVVFSRRMTRSLRHLAEGADHIAGGRWAQRVPLEGPAEARVMADAFNRMTGTISHWHEQAEERARQLGDAYVRFRSVTDSVGEAIVSMTMDGEIVFWNRQAETIFGYTEGEALGRSIELLVPDRHREEYADGIQRLSSGDRSWLGATLDVAGRRRDGTEVPIELALSTWKAASTEYVTGVLRDITERRQAAEALRVREEQLRQAQKMEAIGRLAGGVAHDFNNLLTGIVGYADLLVERLEPEHPLRRHATEIQKAGRTASSLTRDLLAFSRKQARQPVVLSLNDAIANAENLLRRLIGADIDLVVSLAADLRPVKADPSQVQQVLMNLAVNARDAMPRGGRLTIATANLAGAGVRPLPAGRAPHVVLTVSDTGTGIRREVLPHLFEPFFTTKPVGHGTGLGLAIVYGIVQQSEGDIWVDSVEGRGSAFTICLPAARAPAEPLAEPAPGVEGGCRGSETVLIAEDDPVVRAMTCDALQRYGYSVIAAANGREALEAVSASLGNVSIVLSDVVMPLVGGLELAARLHAQRPELPVVFMSGHANDPAFDVRAVAGGAAFLQKPFGPSQLVRTLREVLDAREVGSAEAVG